MQMRVSLEWLQEYVAIDNLTAAELAEKLTMAGIPVEFIEDQAQQYHQMVVGKINEIKKHPQADNLLVLKMDLGEKTDRQIITAAQNVAVGNLIPVALPGAVLPDGQVINEVSFKGAISQGMLCSAVELGLAKEAAGVWHFEAQVAPGTSVAAALGATDQILILELTPNRGDCLGMLGVAREVAALLETEVKYPELVLKEEGAPVQNLAAVEIQAPELCARYAARVVTEVVLAPSPRWLQRCLIAAGVRPINNMVDITNYVMLEYNQPLHAFDLERIAKGQIKVRRAQAGEKLVTLDDLERDLQEESLVIADPEAALCVAGVMGGASSEVTAATKEILLEAACFNPVSIRKTAKQLGMRTESSYRFERRIDPQGVINALNRAVHLIEELGVGKVAKGYVEHYPESVAARVITTTTTKINAWLGTKLPVEVIKGYLERLNFSVAGTGAEELLVTVPTYRPDILHMADLAEEVARLHGYHQIPATFPVSKQTGQRTPKQQNIFDCRKFFKGIGLSEIITYSFYGQDVGSKLHLAAKDPLKEGISLLFPLTEEQSVMRTNLVFHLLETLAFNDKRRETNLRVFEIANVYFPQPEAQLANEELHLGIALMGQREEPSWNSSREAVDFYDLKGILECFFQKYRLPQFTLKPAPQPFLHPGQSATIWIGEKQVGFLGQVHPNVQKEFEITRQAFVMELHVGELFDLVNERESFKSLPRFPMINRDLALVVAKEVTAARIMADIQEKAGELLEKVALFDVYEGDQVPAGMRSLAFSLTYRSAERTLNDQEVNELQAELLKKLNAAYGASIR